MKTMRIWIWSLVFGILATVIIYGGFLSNFSTPAATSENAGETEENKDEASKGLTELEEEIVKERTFNNPMYEVSEGMRAISIKVEVDQGVSGYVTPGSFVDIIAYATTRDEQTKKEYKSAVLILQNKKVLSSGKSSDNEEEALHYGTVTLEVTPREGVMLSLAAKDKDGFYLMLRNSSDTGVEEGVIEETREVLKEDNPE
ncbi:Flp pilus assembly protein CpaB [Bacillus timonensis]|nr:Flp pilus assembly protein CpaB [Bacillus timonensis]